MNHQPAILGPIREMLEASLSGTEPARVMLDALARWGSDVPSNRQELEAFVRGPLNDALTERVEPDRRLQILRDVELVLRAADTPTVEQSISDEWTDESTVNMPVLEAPVPVLLVAGSQSLAMRLRAALGPERVSVKAYSERADVQRALVPLPLIVLLDATDVPAVAPDDLLALLETAPVPTTSVVWGSDLAYGRRFMDACARSRRHCAGIRVGDGLESILDLVVSRRVMPAREQ